MVDRTVWTGNATRRPLLRGVEYRTPADLLPNADIVMERGCILPLDHALADEHIQLVIDTAASFLDGRSTAAKA